MNVSCVYVGKLLEQEAMQSSPLNHRLNLRLKVEVVEEKEVGVHYSGDVWYVDKKDVFKEV